MPGGLFEIFQCLMGTSQNFLVPGGTRKTVGLWFAWWGLINRPALCLKFIMKIIIDIDCSF